MIRKEKDKNKCNQTITFYLQVPPMPVCVEQPTCVAHSYFCKNSWCFAIEVNGARNRKSWKSTNLRSSNPMRWTSDVEKRLGPISSEQHLCSIHSWTDPQRVSVGVIPAFVDISPVHRARRSAVSDACKETPTVVGTPAKEPLTRSRWYAAISLKYSRRGEIPSRKEHSSFGGLSNGGCGLNIHLSLHKKTSLVQLIASVAHRKSRYGQSLGTFNQAELTQWQELFWNRALDFRYRRRNGLRGPSQQRILVNI